MAYNKLFALLKPTILILLVFPHQARSQQYFSLEAGLGLGKVQFYKNFHSVYFGGQRNEGLIYSPSWNITFKSTWLLSNHFDLAVTASHTTITHLKGAINPSWTNGQEDRLIQGFIHFIPSLSYNPNSKFTLTSGLMVGIANPIDPGNAEESSNSFLNTDIALTNQFWYKLNDKIQVGIDWIEGLTYYDYFEQHDPDPYYSFFKYRTFLIKCQYDLRPKL